jgi:transmembrane sensor
MLVTEGRVSVEKPVPTGTAVADPIATVGAGHKVELAFAQNATAEVVPTPSTEIAEKLAWRVPRIEFNETPLWKVVSLLNQHSSSKISLASDRLGRLEISGALRADNIEPLLSILESNYNIQVVRGDGREIELRQAP